MRKRVMIESDLPTVYGIFSRAYTVKIATQAQLERMFSQKACGGLVAEQGEDIVGCSLFLFDKHQLVLLAFAVDPPHQKTGVGRYLMTALLDKLNHKRPRLRHLILETNFPAIRFLQKLGFLATSLERKPFDEHEEDGIMFTYTIDEMDMTPPANRVYATKNES